MTLRPHIVNPLGVAEKAHRNFVRVRGRSFIALVLTPELPIDVWLGALDAQLAHSSSFMEGRPVVVDLAAVPVQTGEVPRLIAALQARGVRIIGVEGADDAWPGEEVWGRPPMALTRPDKPIDLAVPANEPEAAPKPTSLVVDEPVRSGQSIVFATGDLTVLGSVASGAELVAGGSIHVYGVLRGRAIAGLTGYGKARIFVRRFEAELLAIDGVYKSADDMDPSLRGRSVQAWLQGESLLMAATD